MMVGAGFSILMVAVRGGTPNRLVIEGEVYERIGVGGTGLALSGHAIYARIS